MAAWTFLKLGCSTNILATCAFFLTFQEWLNLLLLLVFPFFACSFLVLSPLIAETFFNIFFPSIKLWTWVTWMFSLFPFGVTLVTGNKLGISSSDIDFSYILWKGFMALLYLSFQWLLSHSEHVSEMKLLLLLEMIALQYFH